MPRRILLADDHEGIRRRVRYALETAGFEVCGEAANGLDAVAKTKILAPDLIILNLSMPVMNGLQAIPEIAKCAPGVRILVFTMDDAHELRRETLRLGAHGYISKSSSMTELIDEVTKLLI